MLPSLETLSIRVGRIVGISEHCDDSLTYSVLHHSTHKVIHISSNCPASAVDLNLHAKSLGGKIDYDIAPVLKSFHYFNDDATKLHTTNDNPPPPSTIDMEDLIWKILNHG
jgi:hypothetical protein